MTPKGPNYIRKEQNGKVVYVPNPETRPKGTQKPRQTAQPAYFLEIKQVLQSAFSFIGAWLPPLALTSGGLTTISLGWIGWQSLTNPDMTFWINQFAPGNLNRKIPAADQPKTLEQIQAQLERNGKTVGSPVVLASDFSFLNRAESSKAFAFPIFATKSKECSHNCDVIQELHVYRTLNLPKLIQIFQRKSRFRRVSRIRVMGPSERDLNTLIKSVIKGGNRTDGNVSPMGMNRIATFSKGQVEERWFLLSGLSAKGNASVAYGQLMHYSPRQSRLSVMVNWISPSGKAPIWKDITKDNNPEILIDQSLELEPSFRAYEISQAPSGVRLVTPIQFETSAIADSEYRLALKLAQSRLWLAANDLMTKVEPRLKEQWNSEAEGQRALIQMHAEFFQANADLVFSDAVEEMQSLLVRGQWAQALRIYQQNKDIREPMQVVLASDQGQIGDRLQFAAEVGPDKTSALDWAILYQSAKGGKAQAEKWLKANHPNGINRIKTLEKQLNPPKTKSPESKQSEIKQDP